MAWRTLIAVLVMAFAGCFGGQAPPSDSTTRAGQSPVVQPQSTANGAVYELEADQLSYSDELVQFALVADEDIVVRVEMSGTLGLRGLRNDCFVATAFAVGGQPVAPEPAGGPRSSRQPVDDPGRNLLGVVTWSYPGGMYYVGADAADYHVNTSEPSSSDRGYWAWAPIQESAAWSVPAGGSVVVQLGGHSPACVSHDIDSETPATFSVHITVEGASHVEPLPSAPLHCGSLGTLGRNARAHARTSNAIALFDAGESFETRNATSVYIWKDATSTGSVEGAAGYPGGPRQPIGPSAVDLYHSSNATGSSFVELERWVESLSLEFYWIVVDAWWPEKPEFRHERPLSR